jgi:hypothetical protein
MFNSEKNLAESAEDSPIGGSAKRRTGLSEEDQKNGEAKNRSTASASSHAKRVGRKISGNTRRINLTVPQPVYDELERLAVENHTSELELIRTALRVLILGLRAQQESDGGLILRTDGSERLLLLA